MKKATIFAIFVIAIAVSSCGNATENKTATSTDSTSVATDSTNVDSAATTVDTCCTK